MPFPAVFMAAFTVVVATSPGPVAGQSLEDAVHQYEQGDVGALASFEAVLRRGGLQPREVANVYRYVGVLHLALRSDEREAVVAFQYALAIDHQLTAPIDLSPEQREVFERVRTAQAGPLVLAVTQTDDEFEVHIDAAPEGLVDRVELFLDEQSLGVRSAPWRWAAASDHSGTTATAVAFDRHGNALHEVRAPLELRVSSRPEVAAAAAMPPTGESRLVPEVIAGSGAVVDDDDDDDGPNGLAIGLGVGAAVLAAALAAVLVIVLQPPPRFDQRPTLIQ